MKRLLVIFALLLLAPAGLLGWRGERELALWLGGGAVLVLFLLGAYGHKGLNADLPREARERRHWYGD